MAHLNNHTQDGIHIFHHSIMHHQLDHLHIRMKERRENDHHTHCMKKNTNNDVHIEIFKCIIIANAETNYCHIVNIF